MLSAGQTLIHFVFCHFVEAGCWRINSPPRCLEWCKSTLFSHMVKTANQRKHSQPDRCLCHWFPSVPCVPSLSNVHTPEHYKSWSLWDTECTLRYSALIPDFVLFITVFIHLFFYKELRTEFVIYWVYWIMTSQFDFTNQGLPLSNRSRHGGQMCSILNTY